MEKMISRYRFVVLLFAVIILLGTFTACRGEYFFDNNGIYYSEDPFIEIDCANNRGTMIVDEITYHLSFGYANNGIYIKIYDEDVRQQLDRNENGHLIGTDSALIWKADTKEKNGKLYLTVTEDNISNYVGKTIVLEFIPNEK